MTVSFAVTAASTDFMPQLKWQFSQQMISLALLYFICYFVQETNYFKEADVIVPTYVDEIVHGRVDVEQLRSHAAGHSGDAFVTSSRRHDLHNTGLNSNDDKSDYKSEGLSTVQAV